MTFSGVVSGPGSLRFVGDLVVSNYTTLTLSGAAANTYSGATVVEQGTLRLNKSANITASPAVGNLNTVIGNVAPNFTAFGTTSLKSGEALATALTFADPGSDTWTVTVNYGDGTGVQPLVVGPGKSLALNHAFPTNGIYTVTVMASDDDTGTGTGTLTVVVGLELTISKRNLTHSFARWPAVFNGFTLQSTPTLPAGTNWTTVAEAAAVAGDQWQVTLPHTNGNAFFRLFKP